MTYGQFLAVMLVPPALVLLALGTIGRRFNRRLGWALLVTSILAVLYTAPWDNFLIAQSVWSYPPGRVLGPTLGLVPLEEYTFFVLQVILVGLVTGILTRDHS
jgi:lycopene cyclase domain-containing protein